MKKINYFVGLLLVMLAFVFVVSCNDDDEESLEQQWASVLDNHGCAYDFSDAGYCFGDGGGISKKNFGNIIKSQVCYKIENMTGAKVRRVNISVEGIRV